MKVYSPLSLWVNEDNCNSSLSLQVIDLLVLFILHSTNANQSRRGSERLLKVKVRTGLIQEALLQKTFRDYSQVLHHSTGSILYFVIIMISCLMCCGICSWCRYCVDTSPPSWLWPRACYVPVTPVWCPLVDTCTGSPSLCLTPTVNKCVSDLSKIILQD